MNFLIDNKPPSREVISQEADRIKDVIEKITKKDMIITFILILFSSIVAGAVVYWTSGNYYYAGAAVAVFPILGSLLSILGITKTAGFRSVSDRLGELRNELAALNPVSDHDMREIDKLCERHKLVDQYQQMVKEQGRVTVNGELAMYWEFDTSTIAKTAKGRDFLEKAKESVNT